MTGTIDMRPADRWVHPRPDWGGPLKPAGQLVSRRFDVTRAEQIADYARELVWEVGEAAAPECLESDLRHLTFAVELLRSRPSLGVTGPMSSTRADVVERKAENLAIDMVRAMGRAAAIEALLGDVAGLNEVVQLLRGRASAVGNRIGEGARPSSRAGSARHH